MKLKRFYVPLVSIVLTGVIADAAVARDSDQSNEQIPSSALIENSYPLADDAAREKTTRSLQ